MTTELAGTPVVPGVAYGPVLWPASRPTLPSADAASLPDDLRDAESTRFVEAAATVADRLRGRASASSGAAAEVLTATAALAQDRGWIGAATALIASGTPAPVATVAATEKFTTLFTQLGGLMAERVTDLLDVRDRVLAELDGLPEPGVPTPEVPSILCADDLAPADTAGLDPSRVIALVTRLGGPTSHTAIIARQLGIPCVVAVPRLHEIPSATLVLVDGGRGVIDIAPDPDDARGEVARAAERAEAISRWQGPGHTADGHPVAVLANVADGVSAHAAASAPVEGVGLFRTELAFLDRTSAPTVAEQTALYRDVLDAFDGQKVVIRTLDAGSDKPLAFAPGDTEANPALGVRGIRMATPYPELLDDQLDAIAAAAAATDTTPWVMAPMIATAAEARTFAAAVRSRGLIPGVMIEVPAAALLAEAVMAEVDFVSLGTNDLTQYTMAADRMSPALAALTDPWQPAVLSLIATVGSAGTRTGTPVGVCGEAAADPLLAPVLVGLGVTSLSCAPAAAAAVGSALSTLTLQTCRDAARAACATSDPAAARAAAEAVIHPH
ncbi:phosphoenolpyruvate--protein phosphotransferase [Gordonia jinhuaensis]|nr:putative PEP-binding protein [Gordonia jinhuaensis]